MFFTWRSSSKKNLHKGQFGQDQRHKLVKQKLELDTYLGDTFVY